MTTKLPSDETTNASDLRQPWLNIARKLQHVADNSGNRGIAVLTMYVVIDESGLPQTWYVPDVVKLEPRGNADRILALLTR